MRFSQFPPPPELTEHVRCFWTVDSGSDAGVPRSFNTVADGFPGALVVLPGGSTLIDGVKGEMPFAFLYGQATTCRTLSAQGTLRAMGLFFQPPALRTLFGLKADPLTDACLDLELTVDGPALVQALRRASSAEACMAIWSTYLTERLKANADLIDASIGQAAQLILQARGDIKLPELCGKLALEERTFERRFKRSVGISPRLFARIRRFQHTLHLLRVGDHRKLSDIAYAADYADQSHYIRSFKEFTGISPLEFRRDGREVVENLVELPPE
ncbi:MAG TPA: helix-turn-helix domain-containing protein [Flavobacteriales bacterium]